MRRNIFPHLTVIMALMDVSIQLYSVRNSPKLNGDGMKTEETQDPGTKSGAVRYQKAFLFRLWQKSVKIDGITPELRGFYRTFAGFRVRKKSHTSMMQLFHRQRSARRTVFQSLLNIPYMIALVNSQMVFNAIATGKRYSSSLGLPITSI